VWVVVVVVETEMWFKRIIQPVNWKTYILAQMHRAEGILNAIHIGKASAALKRCNTHIVPSGNAG